MSENLLMIPMENSDAMDALRRVQDDISDRFLVHLLTMLNDTGYTKLTAANINYAYSTFHMKLPGSEGTRLIHEAIIELLDMLAVSPKVPENARKKAQSLKPKLEQLWR